MDLQLLIASVSGFSPTSLAISPHFATFSPPFRGPPGSGGQVVLGSLTELVKRGKDGTAVVAKGRQTEMVIVPRPWYDGP